VLRRGLLPALGVIGILAFASLVAAGFYGLVTWEFQAAGGLLALLGAILVTIFGSGAFFAAFALALEKPPTVREVLRRTLECSAQVAPSLFFAVFPAAVLPTIAALVLSVCSGEVAHVRDRLVFVPVFLLFGYAALWVWSDYVVLPAAAVFTERVEAKVAQARAHLAYKSNPLRLLVATNAPWLLVVAAIPTGPLQDRLAAVLTPDVLDVVRVCVGLAALVVALVLHAAGAVAAYASSAPHPGPPPASRGEGVG